MTTDSGSEKRYTDEEVRELLDRAAQLESQGASLPAPVQGPTLGELEAIASEAGIDASLIRQAARELNSPLGRSPASTSGPMVTFLGAPVVNELTRTVPVEADTELLEGLVPLIQQAADGVGHPSLLGRTFTWQGTNSSKNRTLQVTVSVGRGETRLAIEERYGELAGGLFGGMMGGGGGGVGLGVGLGFGLGAMGSVLFATVFPVAVIGGFYGLARTIYSRVVKGRQDKLDRLMEELVRAVEEG